jgi:hypothetical protein
MFAFCGRAAFVQLFGVEGQLGSSVREQFKRHGCVAAPWPVTRGCNFFQHGLRALWIECVGTLSDVHSNLWMAMAVEREQCGPLVDFTMPHFGKYGTSTPYESVSLGRLEIRVGLTMCDAQSLKSFTSSSSDIAISFGVRGGGGFSII